MKVFARKSESLIASQLIQILTSKFEQMFTSDANELVNASNKANFEKKITKLIIEKKHEELFKTMVMYLKNLADDECFLIS